MQLWSCNTLFSNCCKCWSTETQTSDIYIEGADRQVENGDYQQEYGFSQHALEILRQLVNQNNITHDESPPPYEEYQKYPKSNEDETLKSSELNLFTSQPRQLTLLDIASQESNHTNLNSNSHIDQNNQSWIEPYPKPPEDPPPVLSNWIASRLASFRRSIVNRLSMRISNQHQSDNSDSNVAVINTATSTLDHMSTRTVEPISTSETDDRILSQTQEVPSVSSQNLENIFISNLSDKHEIGTSPQNDINCNSMQFLFPTNKTSDIDEGENNHQESSSTIS